jgi:hypothetical protein
VEAAMDELEQTKTQITALLHARDYLLHQAPSDVVAVADVTEKIVDVTRRQTYLIGRPRVRALPVVDAEALMKAATVLEMDIGKAVSADAILADVITVFSIGRDPGMPDEPVEVVDLDERRTASIGRDETLPYSEG